jgi:hypothetical protein
MKVSFDEPYYEELMKYPGRFAHPVFFGPPSGPYGFTPLANGTGTLLKFGNLVLGVTCHHVLEAYRKKKAQNPNIVFQFSGASLEPDDFLIQEDKNLDLATLDLSSKINEVIEQGKPGPIEPSVWPPEGISTDDVIAFAGFPGNWREDTPPDYSRFYLFSSGAAKVHSVTEDHLVTRIEVEKCITQVRDGKNLGSLSGMSGGPVFVWRKTNLLRAEIVGFIYEYQETFDLMHIRSARVIREDGTFAK